MLNLPLSTNFLNKLLTKNTIINIVTIILIINIVAKPLTLLSPNINNITAAIKVVILASIIETKDPLLPLLNASSKLFLFLNSSFIRSKLNTVESTAIPIPITTAAILGSVNLPPTKLNITNVNIVYVIIPILDINPLNLYKIVINNIISATAITPAINVFFNASLPKDGSTFLLDNSTNLVGKLPELIKSLKLVASSYVKLPVNCTLVPVSSPLIDA